MKTNANAKEADKQRLAKQKKSQKNPRKKIEIRKVAQPSAKPTAWRFSL